MNYYEHHLGDYAKNTSHLSMAEDGAYRRLIDAYYIREKPLPGELKDVCRLARANTKPERDAVQAVLAEFFYKDKDGWRHNRCDAEIDRYQAKQPRVEARKENDRERQNRARERRREMFSELREHGITAPWDATTEQLHALLRSASDDADHAHVTEPVTRDNTATHTPDTKHQAPDISSSLRSEDKTRKRVDAVRPDEVPIEIWADFLAIRKAKRAPLTDTALDGIKGEATKAGITLEQALRECCLRGWQGFRAEWLKDKAIQVRRPAADDFGSRSYGPGGLL
ncbi:hypothetical protein B9Z44_01200 [Limnohabitans curvus]|uniref:DUF1376 domain-containing protein n=1 Tax=Limnohabitans curvus TaxID=323423 RepID=A0A315EMB8_9BURK|nr:YdaU family protein [Limnohabitans curvus]PUE58339.1 hypothetical protein B9Z44_01200 [Limnohabitans curvus]